MINALWGKGKSLDLKPAGTNLFVVQFHTDEARDFVLDGGPWHINNQPIIVRKWEWDMEGLEFGLARIPVWVQLTDIPLELFHKRGIGYIASALGFPLYMDQVTANLERLAYARVCVEIDASTEIPDFIEVEMVEGRVIHIFVKVPWKPLKCSISKIYGHSDRDYFSKSKGKQAQKWIPKKDTCVIAKTSKHTVQPSIVEKSDIVSGTQPALVSRSMIVPSEGPMKDLGELVEDAQVTAIHIKDRVLDTLTGMAGSVNQYAVLEAGIEEVESEEDPPEVSMNDIVMRTRKPRKASAGVKNAVNAIKTKKTQFIEGAKSASRASLAPSGKSLSR